MNPFRKIRVCGASTPEWGRAIEGVLDSRYGHTKNVMRPEPDRSGSAQLPEFIAKECSIRIWGSPNLDSGVVLGAPLGIMLTG